jgi:hypothetical protein
MIIHLTTNYLPKKIRLFDRHRFHHPRCTSSVTTTRRMMTHCIVIMLFGEWREKRPRPRERRDSERKRDSQMRHRKQRDEEEEKNATISLMSRLLISISTLLLVLLGRTTHAFVAVPNYSSSNSCCISRETDRSCPSTTLQMTVLTSGSKKIDIPEGTPLKDACAKLGVKPKYSCKR